MLPMVYIFIYVSIYAYFRGGVDHIDVNHGDLDHGYVDRGEVDFGGVDHIDG